MIVQEFGQTILQVFELEPKRRYKDRLHVQVMIGIVTTFRLYLFNVENNALGSDLSEAIFESASNNSQVLCAKTLLNGRVFLGGVDSLIQEVEYQSGVSTITRSDVNKMYKISRDPKTFWERILPLFIRPEVKDVTQFAIDETRHVLYTLNVSHDKQGIVEIFDLGEYGLEWTHVVKIYQREILSRSQDLIHENLQGLNEGMQVVNLQALEQADSAKPSLVLLTNNGTRIYLRIDFQPSGHESRVKREAREVRL